MFLFLCYTVLMNTRLQFATLLFVCLAGLVLCSVGVGKLAAPAPDIEHIFGAFMPGNRPPAGGRCQDMFSYWGEGSYFICIYEGRAPCERIYVSGSTEITHLSAHRCAFLLGDLVTAWGNWISVGRYRRSVVVRWQRAYAIIPGRGLRWNTPVRSFVIF